MTQQSDERVRASYEASPVTRDPLWLSFERWLDRQVLNTKPGNQTLNLFKAYKAGWEQGRT